MHESQRLAAEPRADERTHEQLEPHVAVGARAREAERLRRLRQLGVGGGERIKRELAGEDVPVADALAGALCAHPAEQLAHQRFHLLHERLQREPETVPLDQREFRVVQPAAFPGAHHVTDLVDVAAAGGEQALHGVLGRGVQEQQRGGRGPCPGCRRKLHRGAVNMHVTHGRIHQQRRVDLEHATGGEELPRAREQRRALDEPLA